MSVSDPAPFLRALTDRLGAGSVLTADEDVAGYLVDLAFRPT